MNDRASDISAAVTRIRQAVTVDSAAALFGYRWHRVGTMRVFSLGYPWIVKGSPESRGLAELDRSRAPIEVGGRFYRLHRTVALDTICTTGVVLIRIK